MVSGRNFAAAVILAVLYGAVMGRAIRPYFQRVESPAERWARRIAEWIG